MSDADDLVQIALERALSKSDQFREGAPLAGWMFGILRNAWIDETRGRSRRGQLFVPEAFGENVADPQSVSAAILPVQQAMQRLSNEQREVVSLVLIEGLSYQEAAQIVGVPVGTITSRLARGREALQTMLSDNTREPA